MRRGALDILERCAGFESLRDRAGARVHIPDIIRQASATGDLAIPFAIGALANWAPVIARDDRAGALALRPSLQQRPEHIEPGQVEHGGRGGLGGRKAKDFRRGCSPK